MGPTEPDPRAQPTADPSSAASHATATPAAEVGTRARSTAEPPQLAYVPLDLSREPITATIVPGPTQPVTRRNASTASYSVASYSVASAPVAARPGTGTRGWLDTLSEPSEDPARLAANYAKALFSQEAQEALFGGRPVDKIYSAPRRFDLATLFVVSTAFAALFTLLGYIGFTSGTKLSWCVFFSGVGVAQAALYNARAPRVASVLAGGLLMPLLAVRVVMQADLVSAIGWSIGSLIAGPPCGYLAGTLIGGVFLVADKLRNWIAHRRAVRTGLPT